MKIDKIKKIILIGLFAAITTIATIAITIPIGSSGGYINFGDSIIFIVSILFTPILGGVSGAIGATIADLLIAPQYAVFTLIIKLVEGLICGYIYHKNKQKIFLTRVVSMFLAMLWMIGGYFITELILFNFSGALLTLIPNLIQGSVSLIIGTIVSEFLLKSKLFK